MRIVTARSRLLAIAAALLVAAAPIAQHRVSAQSREIAPADTALPSTPPTGVAVTMPRVPLVFERNAQEDAPFTARVRGYRAEIAPASVRLAFRARPGEDGPPAIVLELDGADVRARRWAPSPSGHAHYLKGPRPSSRTLHARVGFDRVYPGIDVRYYGTDGQLEQDFEVAAGADTDLIRMRARGARLSVDETGGLVIADSPHAFRLEPPRAWHPHASQPPTPVEVRYRLHADGSAGFMLAGVDATRPLVIDPVLNYSTAIGGSGYDEASAVALDPQGNVYVAGLTTSSDLPATRLGSAAGDTDIFVAKLDPTAQTILYMTVFGGTDVDEVRGLAVDAAGRAHVTGMTFSTDFPMVAALAGQQTARGGADAFITTLAAGGSSLAFSTYLGGSGADEAHGIALAPDGGVVIAGDTRSADFPLQQARQTTNLGLDGFVVRITSGGTLAWSTFHGGQASDSILGVAVGADGSVAVAGTTDSSDFPVQNAAQGRQAGYDAFVSRFTSTGALAFSTFLGGSAHDAAEAVAIDASGAVHVAGSTRSSDFPGTVPSLGGGGGMDVFVAAYTSAGTPQGRLRLGGTGIDTARAIVVNASGTYVSGQTTSADFPLLRPAQFTNAGNRDAFVLMLRGQTPVYSTYVGTSGNDDALGLAVDGLGRAIVTGALHVSATANRGESDAFVFRLSSGDENADSDNNGLPDAWETQFNLDPTHTDAQADPDGDGWTNLQEYQRGTHPMGLYTRYLAEGATISPFKTTLALFNPSERPAAVLLRFLCQRACGVPEIAGQDRVVRRLVTLAPFARGTVDVGTVPGLEREEFATLIEADQPVVVDRTMTWDDRAYGSHAETAMLAPSPTWYLAEGATISGFKLFYLLQNPNDVTAEVTIEYLRGGGKAPIIRTYTLPPQSRTTIDVSAADANLKRAEVSASITTSPDTPILVERSMYLDAGGRLFGAGHASAGVTTPAPTWSFAEGATGNYFDTFILLANPSDEATTIRATFLLPDGRTVTRDYALPAKSRENIWVDQAAPELNDTAVSTVVESLDDRPFIAERSMWWPGPTSAQWREAHNSPGSLATSTRWGLADGMLGGPTAVETYFLVANTSPFPGTARVTLFFEDDGSRLARQYAVAANSRANVPISVDFPQATGRRFATLIDSLGSLPAQLVVERAMYSNSGSEVWAAGTNALGTPLANEKLITITAQGVTPKVLLVSPGDQVTVRNLDSVPHQFSSGPYLERSQCPAFNQVGFLAAGQARTTGNFTTPGVCGFLDDVAPGQQTKREFQGFVIVK